MDVYTVAIITRQHAALFAYYRHISGAALNLVSHPIKVSTERRGQKMMARQKTARGMKKVERGSARGRRKEKMEKSQSPEDHIH